VKKSVAIIGGGIAGLTTAFKLQKEGIEVTLLETASHTGGVMWSISSERYLVETGPNTILETSPKVTELVSDLGLDSEKIYANEISKTRYIVRNNQLVPLPLSPGAFLRSSLFSLRAKLRLLKEPFIDPWDNQYEESLSQFVIRRLGQEFLDYAINPFVAGVYAGDPDHLSVQHGFPKLYALEQKYGSLIKGQIKGAKERREREEESKQKARMFSFKYGLKTLPATLEKALGPAVRKNTVVTDISPKGNKWEITYRTDDRPEETLNSDYVVYAGTVYQLSSLTVERQRLEDFECFREIYHPPITVLVLGFKREDVRHPLDGFGMLIPKIEGYHILGALFSSTLFPNRAPEGHVSITTFIGGARQPEYADKPENDLVEITLDELKNLLGVSGKPTFVKRVYWPKSIPQYDVGYGRFKNKLDELTKRYSGLYFAGNYINGISVADTIVQSYSVANKIIERTKGTEAEKEE
jgi:oxygen-dependent protoporphyrinogen oxidase